jgi:hypothetical protein
MSDSEEDPLQRVVVDKEAINREQLADAIDGVVGVDGDDGELVPQAGYHELSNKSKFVARLLARRATVALNITEEEEIGASSGDLAERMDPSSSTIQNYGSLDFVANDDEHGGYYIPSHSVGLAIEYLSTNSNE